MCCKRLQKNVLPGQMVILDFWQIINSVNEEKIVDDILKRIEKSDMNIGISTLILIFTILILCLASLASYSHAETSTSTDDTQKTTTSGGTLDVKLEPSPGKTEGDPAANQGRAINT